jgi:hypothetical protein
MQSTGEQGATAAHERVGAFDSPRCIEGSPVSDCIVPDQSKEVLSTIRTPDGVLHDGG